MPLCKRGPRIRPNAASDTSILKRSCSPAVHKYGLHESIDIVCRGPMIDDGGADDGPAADGGQGWRDPALLMQVRHDFGIQAVGIGTPVAEADDVQWYRGKQFQFRLGNDACGEALCQRDRSCNDPTDRVGTVCLQREPRFQSAKPARQVGAVVARPPIAASQASFGSSQISGLRGESLALQSTVAHQQEAGIIWNLTPFMPVERQ